MRLLRKAEKSAKEMRVVKLVVGSETFNLCLFVGRNRDHWVTESSCDCEDFRYNVVYRKLRPFCYHTLTAEISMRKDEVKVIHLTLDQFRLVREEISKNGKSLLLRRLLFSKGAWQSRP